MPVAFRNTPSLRRPRIAAAFAASLLGATALSPVAALARDQTEAADEAHEPVIHDRVVVTSSALRTLESETLQHVDVMTIDEIQDDISGSLGDTLAALPGVSSSFYGPAAGRPVVRGLGGERTRVLTNGVGLVDASSISPDHAVSTEGLEAERIEVLRGSSALAYGGNAISGVINVIDGTIPSAAPENGVAGQFYASGESVNEGGAIAGALTAALGPLVITAQGVHREANDYDIPGFAESALFHAQEEAEEHEHEEDEDHEGEDHDDQEEEEEEAFGTVPNTAYEFDSASLGASLVGDWGFFGLAVKTFDSRYGIPGHSHAHGEEEHHDEDHDHDEDDHDHEEEEHGHEEEMPFIDMEQTRIDLRGEVELGWGLIDAARVSASHADYSHTEFEAPREPGTVFDVDGWEGRLELTQAARGGWTGAFGLQAQDKTFSAEGEEAFLPETDTTVWGGFITQRYDSGGWGVEGGAHLESTSLENAAHSRDFTTFSGSVGAFARPLEGLFVGATIAHAERAPGDAELFADGPHPSTSQYEIGDPDLDAEKALTLEGVARYDAGPVSLDASIWRADYDGFIFLAETGEELDGFPVYRQTQADAELWGAELGASAHLASFGNIDLDSDVVLEYTRGRIDGGADLPRIPPFSATFGLEAATQDDMLEARVELVAVAEQDNTFPGELPTDGYEMVNTRLTWRPMQDRDFRIIASVRNLTDQEGRVHTSYLKDILPLPGRSYRLAVAASF